MLLIFFSISNMSPCASSIFSFALMIVSMANYEGEEGVYGGAKLC